MHHNKPMTNRQKKEYFKQLYKTYRDEMYYVAYSYLQNCEEAEDLVHDTFMAIIPKLDEMKGNSEQKNWNFLLTILKHKAINLCKWRKRYIEKTFLNELLEEVYEEEPFIKIVETERQEYCSRVLSMMSESYRDLLLMHYYYDMDATEISRKLEKSPDNVRHMLSRARKRFKELWNGNEEENEQFEEERKRKRG